MLLGGAKVYKINIKEAFGFVGAFTVGEDTPSVLHGGSTTNGIRGTTGKIHGSKVLNWLSKDRLVARMLYPWPGTTLQKKEDTPGRGE